MNNVDDGPTWSDIASWYDDLIVAGSGPHQTAISCLLNLLPPLDGATVLDVACGQGLATRALAEAGAMRVIGVDLSTAMIDHARGHGAPPGCEVSYVVGDAQELAAFEAGSFDGATCHLGLMDIPDLEACLAEVHRVLRPGGWFVLVIGHPCFLVPHAASDQRADGRHAVSVTGYFLEGFWRSSNPNGVRRAGNYHRTLSTYLNALARSGFLLDMVREPVATALLAHEKPAYEEVPMFFAARVRKR